MEPQLASPLTIVAKVVGVFGLQGILKAEILTDYPERFSPGKTLMLDGIEYQVQSVGWHKSQARIQLRGLDSIHQAETHIGKLLYSADDKRPQLQPNEYLYADVTGMDVYEDSGKRLGKVDRITRAPAQDLLHVGELMIPAASAFVQEIDIPNNRIVVRLIPGMLDPTEALEDQET